MNSEILLDVQGEQEMSSQLAPEVTNGMMENACHGEHIRGFLYTVQK